MSENSGNNKKNNWNQTNYNNPRFADPEPAKSFMRSLMFHEAAQKAGAGSGSYYTAGLREYDQAWRLRNDGNPPGEEAILVGKVAVEHGSAKDVAAKPSCVSQLKLGAALDGTM